MVASRCARIRPPMRVCIYMRRHICAVLALAHNTLCTRSLEHSRARRARARSLTQARTRACAHNAQNQAVERVSIPMLFPAWDLGSRYFAGPLIAPPPPSPDVAPPPPFKGHEVAVRVLAYMHVRAQVDRRKPPPGGRGFSD
jgi:hypothetical protein